MADIDVWATIDGERDALASDLSSCSPDAWATASLCDDWTIEEVVAHMIATSQMSAPKFFVKFTGSGFSLPKMQAKDIAAERGANPAETLSKFKGRVDSRGRPPGPVDTMLGEVMVHSEDIRRPLGIAHTYPTDALARVADFYVKSNLVIGGKRRVDGVTLQATDIDWSHGSGPAVSGPILDIVLATTG